MVVLNNPCGLGGIPKENTEDIIPPQDLKATPKIAKKKEKT